MITDEDWNPLEAWINFDEYMKCDTDIMTSKLLPIDELVIENKLWSATSSDDDEEKCEEMISPSFKHEMDCFKLILLAKSLLKKHSMNCIWFLILCLMLTDNQTSTKDILLLNACLHTH